MSAARRVLVLGGTGFLGRPVVERLAAQGHRVTVAARGETPRGAEDAFWALDRDDEASVRQALRGQRFDTVLDLVGYTPRQLRPVLEELPDPGQFVYVSAVMVYGDTDRRPVVETCPLLPPAADSVTEIDGDTYGPLKAACEALVEAAYPDRHTILRPQSVVGPGDLRRRLQFWVERAAQGSVELPGGGGDHVQALDARDWTDFVTLVLERGVLGTFHLGGPRLTWAEFARALGVRHPRWVPKADFEARFGTAEPPLYRPERGLYAGLMDLDTSKARQAGLGQRDFADTCRWVREGLTP